MSTGADDLNPYAPPTADTAPAEPRRGRGRRKARGLQEALDRLEEHLADRGEVENDRTAAGRRFRVLTMVLGALFLGSLALAGAGLGDTRSPMLPIGIGLGAFMGIMAAILLVMDLSLVDRAAPSSPDATLKSYLKAIPMARYGYAWATLSPTARDQEVRAPELSPVITGGGDFSLRDVSGMKDYAGSFARPGQGQMRSMAVKRVTLGSVDGDVAEVSAVLAFQSWPQWVNAVIIASFVLFRPLVILGAIFYFATRKRREVSVTATMLRGSNGAWYLYDADLLGDLAES